MGGEGEEEEEARMQEEGGGRYHEDGSGSGQAGRARFPHGPSGVWSMTATNGTHRLQETTMTSPCPSLSHLFFPSPHSLDPLLFDVPPPLVGVPSSASIARRKAEEKDGGPPRHGTGRAMRDVTTAPHAVVEEEVAPPWSSSSSYAWPSTSPLLHPSGPLQDHDPVERQLSLVQEELVDIARTHAVFGLVVGDADQIVQLLMRVHRCYSSSSSFRNSMTQMEEERGEVPQPMKDPLRDVVRQAIFDRHRRNTDDDAKKEKEEGTSASCESHTDERHAALPAFHTFVHWLWGTKRWWWNTHCSSNSSGGDSHYSHSTKNAFYGIVFVAVHPMEDAFLPFSFSPEEKVVHQEDDEREGSPGYGSHPDRNSSSSNTTTGRRSEEREVSEQEYLSSLPEIPYYIAGVLELAREGRNAV